MSLRGHDSFKLLISIWVITGIQIKGVWCNKALEGRKYE